MASSAVSVDVLALRFDRASRRVLVALVRRAWPPFAGQPALPGVLLAPGERLVVAGARAAEKIGLENLHFGQLVTFDEPNRDPRGPTLSVALWGVGFRRIGESVSEWAGFEMPLTDPGALAFDHNRMLTDCRPILAQLLWRDRIFTAGLTGPEFTTTDAADLVAELTGSVPDRGNLGRALAGLPGLTRTESFSATRPTGRPSTLWRWA